MDVPIKPVLIIGAGPTGMTAAMELARQGIPVRIVEKLPSPAVTSRAIGVQARTLELMQQRGMLSEFLKIGNRANAVSTYGDGKQVFRLGFEHVDSEFNFILFISQAETERILREQLQKLNIQVERSVEMIAFSQNEGARGGQGHVSATLRLGDGTLEEVEASYLICAEGAHSTIRNTIKLEFEGNSRHEDYMLGDLHMASELPEDEVHIFSSESGFLGLFPMGGKRWRLIASNPANDTPEPTLQDLQDVYNSRSHVTATFSDLLWSGRFKINSRMVEKLTVGRIFFGGDSAHIHSPAGAQGMNTGIQDMINLSWKLAMVLRNEASPELLKTYDEERLPIIRNVLRRTEALTDAIGSQNHIIRTIYNHVAPLIVQSEIVENSSATTMSQIGLNYHSSSLSKNTRAMAGIDAGERLPNLIINSTGNRASNIFDILNPNLFTLFLINFDDSFQLHADTLALLADRPDLIQMKRITYIENHDGEKTELPKYLGKTPVLTVVRPDGYVGFMGDKNSELQLREYFQKLFPIIQKSRLA